jgi:hypothetical protein
MVEIRGVKPPVSKAEEERPLNWYKRGEAPSREG